jgi:anaerobic ribonucleoside-triphosphate reductase
VQTNNNFLGDDKMVQTRCEIYSRVVGYIRPVEQWNEGKQAEFVDRKLFNKTQTFI